MITAGPTREHLDPVRFITNGSSGRLGLAIAHQLKKAGASVTVVLGPTSEQPSRGIKIHRVTTAREMNKKVLHYRNPDIFIATAAVGDWRLKNPSPKKWKKDKKRSHIIKLIRNPDILMNMGTWKEKVDSPCLIIGFALETTRLIPSAQKKCKEKNCDLVIANFPATFSSDKIKSVWVEKNGNVDSLPQLSKNIFAKKLLEWIVNHEPI